MMKLKNRLAAGVAIFVASFSGHAAAQVNSADISVNILEALVAKGLLTPEEANEILQDARRKAVEDPKGSEVVRVPYVPEAVREEIRDEVKEEVVAQAREERWGTPGALPGWLDRISFYGDLRVRGQGDIIDDGNVDVPDFNAINGLSDDFSEGLREFDPAPLLFTTEDLYRIRIRARLGVDIDLGEVFAGGIRMVTGHQDEAVSVQEDLAGKFDKLFWNLDRAFIRVNADKVIPFEPLDDLTFWFGKFENPFYSTDLMFDRDIALDGAALSARFGFFDDRGSVFGTGGAFPLETLVLTEENKWLLGGQAGLTLRPVNPLTVKLAAAYYSFRNVQGVRNAPDGRATDETAPVFVQKGNTLFNIRNDTDQPGNNTLRLGLASEFEVFSARAGIAYNLTDEIDITVDGEYLINQAFEGDNPNLFALVDIVDRDGTIIGQTLANASTAMKRGWPMSPSVMAMSPSR